MSRIINPYTFIPLQKRTRVQRASASDGEERYTGVIRCSLTTMTELIIPAEKVDMTQPGVATPFFKIGDAPVIPGSSLRGPIRSVYETLTNSCMRVNGGKLHSAGGRKLPGILCWENESYVLYKALRYRVTNTRMANGWRTGQVAHITSGPEPKGKGFMASEGVVLSMSRVQSNDTVEGLFLRVNQMDGKTANKPSVFVRGNRIVGSIDGSFVKCLEETVCEYVANCEDQNLPGDGDIARDYKTCLDQLLKHKNGAALPVWYSYEKLSDGTYAYAFAPSQLSRSVYPKTPVDFVRDLSLQACTSTGSVCPACELFGFVSQDKDGDCKAGKVRFSDAWPKGIVEFKKITIPALLGPHTSAFEFYLRNEQSPQSFTPLSAGTTLSGRKMYWHSTSGAQKPEQEFEEGKKINNPLVECVKRGAKFEFDVYFDEVSKQQLNELVYVLTLGDYWESDANSLHCHKIGHGKPIGAGSVHIKVSSVHVRACDGSSYSLPNDIDWKMELNEEGMPGVLLRLSSTKAVRKVAQFSKIGGTAPISYPREQAGGDIFTWFKDNRVVAFADHGKADESKTLPGYRIALPLVTDQDQSIDREPSGIPKVAGTDHPEVMQYEAGIVQELKVMQDGRWSGWIKREGDSRGAQLVFFRGDENTHIEGPATLQKGTTVVFVAQEADHKNKRTGRIEKQIRAFEIHPK